MVQEQYSRYYINLVGEDNPGIKGYAKFETINGNNQITINLIGVRNEKKYKCYLISAKENNFSAEEIGILDITENRGHLYTTQNPISNLNVISIVDEENKYIAVGYKQNKAIWKPRFEEMLKTEQTPEELPIMNNEICEEDTECNEVYADKINNLRSSFNKHFINHMPFGEESSIEWWKVNNYSTLLEILSTLKCTHCTKFISEYTKNTFYSECIIGIDTEGSKYYLVCGISAIYGFEAKPENIECTWEEEKSDTDSFERKGYWIAGIEI